MLGEWQDGWLMLTDGKREIAGAGYFRKWIKWRFYGEGLRAWIPTSIEAVDYLTGGMVTFAAAEDDWGAVVGVSILDSDLRELATGPLASAMKVHRRDTFAADVSMHL